GPDPLIMVDCHWTLDLPSSRWVVQQLQNQGLTWLEDPFPSDDTLAWAALRSESPIALAGGETTTSMWEFISCLYGARVQVACPDVRFAGGVKAMQRMAALAAESGVFFSPHNPRGPVGTLASAHLCATVPDFLFLEFPFGECDWR